MRITVTGEASARFRPDLAVCHLGLAFESEEMGEALEQVTELANLVGQEFKRLEGEEPSPVTATTVLPPSTSTWRPQDREGRPLPERHRASATARVTFTDFRAMSRFIDSLARRPGVSVENVEWRLNDDNRAQKRSGILTSAVVDAHEKASILAAAAGDPRVSFLELDESPDFTGPQPRMFARAAMISGDIASGGIDLSPEDIEVSATIRAVFTTD